MYSFDAELAGAQVIRVQRREDFGVDVAAIERNIPQLSRDAFWRECVLKVDRRARPASASCSS